MDSLEWLPRADGAPADLALIAEGDRIRLHDGNGGFRDYRVTAPAEKPDETGTVSFTVTLV